MTLSLIVIIIIIYIVCIFGAIEMLIYTREKITSPFSGIVFIPILNCIMTILVLIMKLLDDVTNCVNHRIEYNERNKFKNERL